MPTRLAPLLSGLLLGACSVVGIRDGTEEPRHDRTDRVGTVDIRTYAPRIAAEIDVPADEIAARSEGFRRLAAYIFGANTVRAAIAMTAPVAQDRPQARQSDRIAMTAPVAVGRATDRTGAGLWTIRFFMPARYTLETLPIPNDPAIRIVPVPSQTIAVLGFTGSTAPDAVQRRRTELLRALDGSAWRPIGEPAAWFYDPPWTLPFLRRNEVAAPVERR